MLSPFVTSRGQRDRHPERETVVHILAGFVRDYFMLLPVRSDLFDAFFVGDCAVFYVADIGDSA